MTAVHRVTDQPHDRRGFLKLGLGVACVGRLITAPAFAAPNASAGLKCAPGQEGTDVDAWTPNTPTTPMEKLADKILRGVNPYQTNYALKDWQKQVEKDFAGAVWKVNSVDEVIVKAVRVPYAIQDKDNDCVREAVLVGLSLLRGQATNSISWGNLKDSSLSDLGGLLTQTLTILNKKSGSSGIRVGDLRRISRAPRRHALEVGL